MRTTAKWLKCLFPFVAVPLFLGCQDDLLGPEKKESEVSTIAEPALRPVLVISPGHPALGVGESLQLELIWEDGGVAYEDHSRDVIWIVESPAIASVTEEGLVVGLQEGTTRITADNEEGFAAAFLKVKSR